MKVLLLSVVVVMSLGRMTLSAQTQVKGTVPQSRPTPEPILVRKESGTFKHIKGTPGRIPKIFEITPDINPDDYDWGQLEFGFKLGQGTCRASFGFSTNHADKGVYDRIAIPPGSSFQLERTYSLFELRKNNRIYVYVSEHYLPLFDGDCENTYELTIYFTKYQRYLAPMPYQGTLGNDDYYDFRYKDFIRRNPGRTPPDYYKDFGEKYLRIFLTETYPTLSPNGQNFLKAVGKALQRKIEDKLREDPRKFASLERLPDQFRTFAYFTHPDAYCESGWETLSKEDRSKIITAVNWSDKYLSWRGAVVANKISYRCGSFLDIIP